MPKHWQSFNRHNSELQSMGLPSTFQSMLVCSLSHASFTCAFSRSVPRRHCTDMLMDPCTPMQVFQAHSLIHPFLESFSYITHCLLLLKITSNVKVASIASVPAICRNSFVILIKRKLHQYWLD